MSPFYLLLPPLLLLLSPLPQASSFYLPSPQPQAPHMVSQDGPRNTPVWDRATQAQGPVDWLQSNSDMLDPTITRTSDQQARLLAEFKRLEDSLKQFQEIQSQGIERKFRLQGKQLQEKVHYKMMIQEAEMILKMTKAEQDRERSEVLAMLYSGSHSPNSIATEPSHPRWPTLSTPQEATMTVTSTTDIPKSASVPTSAAPSISSSVPTSAAPSTTASVPTSAAPSTTASVPTSTAPSTTVSVPTSAGPSTSASVPTSAAPSTTASVPTSAAPLIFPTKDLSELKMNLTKFLNYGDFNN